MYGEITAYSSSDKYLKTEIQDFTASSLLNKMNPKTFKWNSTATELNKNKDSESQNFGLIAQELEEVAPSLVKDMYNGKYKGIDYEQIISVLVQGWKEQQERINKLEKYIDKK